MIDELPFKVVRSNGEDEILARAVNLLIARHAYREARALVSVDPTKLRVTGLKVLLILKPFSCSVSACVTVMTSNTIRVGFVIGLSAVTASLVFQTFPYSISTLISTCRSRRIFGASPWKNCM
jgi:hypothetical protein